MPKSRPEELYRQIAESLRGDILAARLQPGERLSSVRELARVWGCTPGTVQSAFRILQESGLIESHKGRGSHVTSEPISPHIRAEQPLRRAALVHRAEAFLLEALTAGHTSDEVEAALRLALDRWRSVEQHPSSAPEYTVRFAGSHDLAVAWVATHFSDLAPGYRLSISFRGSLGGLLALAAGGADMAGCHLWDEETHSYNDSFVRRVLPGRRVMLVTLAKRRLGLIVAPGNPLGVNVLGDLGRPEVRFVNRQAGSGTRVWLDVELRKTRLAPEALNGYGREATTHSEVAQCVAEGEADAGLALQGSALAYGLDFVPLTLERYDLVIPDPDMPGIAQVIPWLARPEAADVIASFGGYLTEETGRVRWVE
jgi:molybdate-binding protein/DNA-binding transcriptional regulator YhcF (GntR family)